MIFGSFVLTIITTVVLIALKFTILSSIPIFILFIPISIFLIGISIFLIFIGIASYFALKKIWEEVKILLNWIKK